MLRQQLPGPLGPINQKRRVLGACVLAAVLLAGYGAGHFILSSSAPAVSDVSSQSQRFAPYYRPTEAEWASLTVAPVVETAFRAEHVTEGKVSIDEDRSTPVFSPYTGRVTRLLVRSGEHVEQGQPLFAIEAVDSVQAQNDYISALTASNKAKSALDLAQTQDNRTKELFEGKAAPLKDYQQSQAALVQAQNDMRSAQIALEAARNRLKILGLSEEAIASFQDKGRINPEVMVVAPIAGTVIQRKIGPGQYVNASSSDPVFVIGDLSTVWLLGYVRETEATQVNTGQEVSFTVLSAPARVRTARVSYVAAAIDPATRRLTVRATVDNADGLLKPEMFANVTVYSQNDPAGVGVPKQALIYEGDQVHVWVAHDDRTIELRPVKVGLVKGNIVEVTNNLAPGEQVVTKGSLFIDRAASAS